MDVTIATSGGILSMLARAETVIAGIILQLVWAQQVAWATSSSGMTWQPEVTALD